MHFLLTSRGSEVAYAYADVTGNVDCPTEANGWHYYDGNAFQDAGGNLQIFKIGTSAFWVGVGGGNLVFLLVQLTY